MLHSAQFLFNTYYNFLKLYPLHIDESMSHNLKKILFSYDDIRKFNLEERKLLLLKSKVPNDLVHSFLHFLWNEECDKRMTDYMRFTFDGEIYNLTNFLDVILKKITKSSICDYSKSLNYYSKLCSTIFEIGFEHFFFDLKEEIILKLFSARNEVLTYEMCLSFYSKETSTLITGGHSILRNNIQLEIISMFNELKYDPFLTKLFFRIINYGIKIFDSYVYNGLFKDKKIYLSSFISKNEIRYLLLHEAMHSICSFESRFKYFANIYKKYFSMDVLLKVWQQMKENVLDEEIRALIHKPKTFKDVPYYKTPLTLMPAIFLELRK